ncbi:hypothetical protein PACTADRAFT_35188 [Pachysolen tannophilus NRRL Y-2460]|uniref:HECT-type E3 ubiquitin transferase E3D n=1 Tax=Pachysolen tannophilus NRRL Y-2460 TaxID=669874 RepID=A0A1E4TRM9_PACTA|nr:hypothetical protein PACTADRAFT_35188 [Pachysolen tannophilus NRRL Y-2460]
MVSSLDLKYYAEYLPRINSISVCIQFHSFYTITGIKLDSANSILITFNNTKNETINLSHGVPSRLVNTDLFSSLNTNENEKERVMTVSFKLPSSINRGRGDNFQNRNDRSINFLMHSFNDNEIWSKKYLLQGNKNSQFCLSCAECGETIISSDKINKLNDMPSESWSEMMDFWHCHKPDSENGKNEHTFNSKRYSVLKPSKNSVIIGNYYFLINMKDFESLIIVDSIPICFKCHCQLGKVESDNKLVKLYKWNFKLNNKETFRPYYHSFNVLIDSINSNASRFFKIYDEKNDEIIRLVLWIFSFGINITNQSEGKIRENCLKIMFNHDLKFITENANEQFNNFEPLYFPSIVVEDLLQEITQNNNRLPQDLQHLNFWNIIIVNKSADELADKSAVVA